jgi:hypothetical protein
MSLLCFLSTVTSSSTLCLSTTTTTIATVNNNANNRPPLFRRYSQIPQVIPSKTYDPNILDIFLERFTNITGKYSKDSDRIISENSFLENVEMNGYKKKLLAKVGFITMYIPDIPRCIQTIVGPEGAAKTSYGKYEKSAVDPSATMMETFIPNAENIKLHFSHNYVTFYNNIRGIPDWVSDLFCLCVSGGDSSQRARYYDSKEFNSKFKHNLILSTIHQVLKESDAVDREFRISLARLDKTKTKSEIEMDAQFEKIKPELLGYTFDILAKAMSLKKPLETYASARMPDFEQWGEAIAQAMGYKECEFRDAYSDLIKIQKQKALSYDPVSEKLRILFNDGSAIKKEPKRV